MSTVPSKRADMVQDRMLRVSTLSIMLPCLWHIWMTAAFDALAKYATESEYEKFLARFSFILEQRVKTGVW